MTLPPDSMIEVYNVMTCAHHAAEAAAIATLIAFKQNDRPSLTHAEKALEAAYCAAGFAWCVKNSQAPVQIEYVTQDAHRAVEAAFAHALQSLEAGLDIDPSLLASYEAAYESLLRSHTMVSTLTDHMFVMADYLSDKRIDTVEAHEIFIEVFKQEPPALPDAQAIEETWNTFREKHPHAFLVPQTLARMTYKYDLNGDSEALPPEALAADIAGRLAAERGPQDECRYCGESFTERAQSVVEGVCHVCDKVCLIDILKSMGIYVIAYNPFTGEIMLDDDTDNASTSLN